MATAIRTIRKLQNYEIDAIGIGIPGEVDSRTGEVRTAVNLGIGSDPYPLADRLEEELGCPVAVENDVRAGALGVYEQARQETNPPGSLTLVNIGTGISAGVVIDGEILRGSRGMAGEIGHVVMDERGPRCRCGQQGCLEAFAAGPAIARDASGRAGSLFDDAASGDAAAVAKARAVVGHLVTALSWLAATYDTKRVVLGGGVTLAGAPFLAMVREEIARRGTGSEIAARRLRPEQVTLVDPSQEPGPFGASLLARRYLLNRRESPAEGKTRQMTNKGEAV